MTKAKDKKVDNKKTTTHEVIIKKKKPVDNPITTQQIIFCEEYIKTQNATQSYLKMRPGAKVTTAGVEGHNLLKKPKIKEYIDKRLKPIQEEQIKRAVADANEILEFITSVVRGEVKDQLGFETSVKDRIKASELLAKRYKLFEEEKPVEGKDENKCKVIVEVVDNSELEKTLYEENK